MTPRRLAIAAPLVAIAAIATTSARAQTSQSVEELLSRVGERIAEFYKRAQNVICIEKSTVTAIGFNYSPEGLSRTVESELRVEPEGGEAPGEAKFVREVRKVNGRPPREKDKKDRESCTDPNPLTTEPLAFLLPAHRSEYRFVAAGLGKDRDREALLIDFASVGRKNKAELVEDPKGRDGCFNWSEDGVAVKGRIWVDAASHEVVRVDQRLSGPVDLKVSDKLQRRYNFGSWLVVERLDVTIRYKTIAFQDPAEALLLPESINMLVVNRGGLQSTRRSQTFSDYKRFVTGGRLVKPES
jgi:hypothetical protein